MADRAVKRALLLLALLCCAALGALYLQAYLPRPYEPQQPVPFDHTTHTSPQQAAIPCLSCHSAAESSASVGMPQDSTCMNCHRHILADDPRLLPLHAAADPDSPAYTGEPLRWRRAYPLPAYARFLHFPHTARYDCEHCHPSPGRESPMLMRECLSCHRRENLPTDCTHCHK